MTDAPTPLLVAVEAFLAEHEMSPVTFGREALNDPHFVRDIRGEGRDRPRRVWPETEDRVRQFMREYQPSTASDEPPPPFQPQPQGTDLPAQPQPNPPAEKSGARFPDGCASSSTSSKRRSSASEAASAEGRAAA